MSHVQDDTFVELSGALTFRDLLKFQYAQCYSRTWWIVALMLLVSFLFVLLALVVLVMTSNFDLVRRNGTPFLLLFLFWIWMAITPYRGAKRQMKTSIPLSSPIRHVFSLEGVEQSGASFSSQISSTDLWAVRETKSLYLLNLSASSALVLPKRFFQDAAQQNEWRAFMERRISPKRIAKTGFLARWL